VSEIKCVLFDIGGVLVDWHMSWITSEISKQFQINDDQVTNAFSRYLNDLDSGKIDERLFWQQIANDVDSISLKQTNESLWNTYFRKHAKPNHDVIKLVHSLKKSHTLGIISNIERVTHKVVDDWNILKPFEHHFMSYQIGFSKPDSRIYRHVIENLPFEPASILFIDDKKTNVDAATDAGLNAIHSPGFASLQSSIAEYDI